MSTKRQSVWALCASALALISGAVSAQLLTIPAGYVTLYLGTGVRSSAVVDAATAVHCTTYTLDPDPSTTLYPFDIVIQFYGNTGALSAPVGLLTINQPDETRTIATQETQLYNEDENNLSLPLDQGSVRIAVPKKHAANTICEADVLSKANPPVFTRQVNLNRVGPKLKRLKDRFE